jgi:hypothetical protein
MRLEPDQGGGAPIVQYGPMRPPRSKPEGPAPVKPAADRPPLRPKTLLQWILERLCMYPSAD